MSPGVCASLIGEVAGEEVLEVAGDEFGEETEAVERRDAAMVRRICDSVLSVAVVTQAIQVPKLASYAPLGQL